MNALRIAVIGGGYAGAGVLTALVSCLPSNSSIVIFDPNEEVGRGIAYKDGPDHYLLNVPAHTISLFPNDESHFCRWVLNRYEHARSFRGEDGSYFVPRAWFGEYVAEQVKFAIQNNPAVSVEHRREIVRAVSRTSGRLSVNNDQSAFDKVVMAIGNSPSRSLPILEPLRPERPALFQSAWEFEPEKVATDAHVVIVGGGLTMADVVASLECALHQGSITCISRNGRRPYVAFGIRPVFTPCDDRAMPGTAREFVSAVRRWAAAAQMQLGDWRPAIDYLRINMPRFWRVLPLQERSRLKRHARSIWEAHRSLMPPAAHRRIEAMIAEGRFSHRSARVLGIIDGGLRVKCGELVEDVRGDVVVNATGFDSLYRTSLAPIEGLISVIDVDPHLVRRDGLAVDDRGRVLDCRGQPCSGVYALGYLARANHGDFATANVIGAIAWSIAEDIVRRKEEAAQGLSPPVYS